MAANTYKRFVKLGYFRSKGEQVYKEEKKQRSTK
jgi:hypothetical protein